MYGSQMHDGIKGYHIDNDIQKEKLNKLEVRFLHTYGRRMHVTHTHTHTHIRTHVLMHVSKHARTHARKYIHT